MNAPSSGRSPCAGLWFGSGMTLLLVIEVALVLYAHPIASVVGPAPLRSPGYEAAAVDVFSSLDFLRRDERGRGYDPTGAAGVPFGVGVDRASPALNLYVSVLNHLGLSRVTALNSFAWFAPLATGLLAIGAAAFMRLSHLGIFTAAALVVAMLNFDGLFRGAAYDGPPLFTLAAGLGLLCLAAVSAGTFSTRRRGAWIAAAGAAYLCGFVHPGAAIFLLSGLVGTALVYRRFGAPKLILMAVVAAIAVLGAYPAMLGAVRSGLSPWGAAGGATPLHILTDALGLVAGRQASGSTALRAGFRVLAWGGALVATVWLARRKDNALGLAVAVLVPSCLAYLGGLLGPWEPSLPYRGLMLGLLGAAVLAGFAVQEMADSGQLAHLPRPVLLCLGLLGTALVPRLAQDIGYFLPEVVPFPTELPEEKPHIADMIGYGDIGYPRHRSFRHLGPPGDYRIVAQRLANVDGKARRVLVESPSLAGYLRANTSAQIAGSLPNEVLGAGADLFQRFPDKDPTESQLRQYLETYAIGWIVVRFNPDPGDEDYRPRLFGLRDLLELVPMKLAQHRVLKVRSPGPYIAGSEGEVEVQGHTLRVSGADPNAELTLRYHYQESLQCRPGCTLERSTVPGDPMGFIKVPAPHPSEFEISTLP